MSNSNKVFKLIGLLAIIILCIIFYYIASAITKHSYESIDIVTDAYLNSVDSVTNENIKLQGKGYVKLVYNEGLYKPECLYIPDDLSSRCKDYLGEEQYSKLSLTLSLLESYSHQYMSMLSDHYINQTGYYELLYNDAILSLSNVAINDLRGYSLIEISSSEINPELEAVWFFDNIYVVYRSKSINSLLIVVDYSNMSSPEQFELPLTDFGDTVGSSLTVFMENTNLVNLNGYDILFYVYPEEIYYGEEVS